MPIGLEQTLPVAERGDQQEQTRLRAVKVRDTSVDELEAVSGKDVEVRGTMARIEPAGGVGRPFQRAHRRGADRDDTSPFRSGAVDRLRGSDGHFDLFRL